MPAETPGNQIAAFENALLHYGSQKRLSLDLGISEGELSKQITGIRKADRLLSHLGLSILSDESIQALRRALKDCL
jgi:biotin operon repressor